MSLTPVPQIVFPPMPERMPPSLHALQAIRRDRRLRILQGLYILAASGLSVGPELRAVMELALDLSPDNRSVQQVFHADLPALDLVIKETPYFIRSSRLALLRLSEQGRRACRELGWLVLESEWERLIRSHEGLLFPRHTLGLLAFCWQARLRGWKVELLPQVGATLEPDVMVSKSGVDIYVEFEVQKHERSKKWKNIYSFQGFVALCSFVPEARSRLQAECQVIRYSGLSTDLQTLVTSANTLNLVSLWSNKW